jgi:hypothetical protein
MSTNRKRRKQLNQRRRARRDRTAAAESPQAVERIRELESDPNPLWLREERKQAGQRWAQPNFGDLPFQAVVRGGAPSLGKRR